jgi:hypothetical protein
LVPLFWHHISKVHDVVAALEPFVIQTAFRETIAALEPNTLMLAYT